MKITPLTEIGSNRALCAFKIHVAAGLKTTAAQRGLYQRKRLGVPVDQCGKRGDFRVDGEVRCRAHAGHEALNHLLGEKK